VYFRINPLKMPDMRVIAALAFLLGVLTGTATQSWNTRRLAVDYASHDIYFPSEGGKLHHSHVRQQGLNKGISFTDDPILPAPFSADMLSRVFECMRAGE